VLTTGTLCYLASLPIGWLSWRRYEREAAAVRPSADATAAGHDANDQAAAGRPPSDSPAADRPARLN
jgi:CDP-diacylglycerol---serine O-phosphatidyltransferase